MSSPSTVSKDRPFDNRSDGNDCSLFKVVPRRSLTQIRFRFSRLPRYEDQLQLELQREKERRREKISSSTPLLFKSPKKLNPYPFCHRHQPPVKEESECFRTISSPAASYDFHADGQPVQLQQSVSSLYLLVASLRRTGATIARRRDYPSFAGQRIFSSWAPPLRRGWRVGGEGIYKAEASHGSVALPASSTYVRNRTHSHDAPIPGYVYRMDRTCAY